MNRQLLHPGLHRLLSVVAVLCSLLGLSGLAEAAASYCTATYTINNAANNRIGFYNFRTNTITAAFPAASNDSNALAQSSANGNLYYIDRTNSNFHKIDVNTGTDTDVGTVNLPTTLVGGTTDGAGNYYIYLADGSFAQVNVTATGNQTVTYKNFTVPTGYTLNNTTNGDFAIDSSGQTYVVAQVTAVPNGSGFAAGTFLWKLNLTSGALTSPVPFRTNANTQWAAGQTANGLSIDPATGAALISTGTGDGTNGAGIYSINLTSGITAFKVTDTTLTDLGTCAVLPNPPTVSKSFNPTSVVATSGTTTLTITIGNTNLAPIFLQADLVDTLPTNMVVAATPAVGGTCNIAGNTITATANTGTITLVSGAKIPANGCTINVNVTATGLGTYTNTIPANALDTTTGKNTAAVSATYTLQAQPTLTLNKTVANPGRINTADQFTVQIKNGATVTANASTTSTGTTATTGSTTLAAGTSYTLTEIMAANSVSALTSYDTAISCTNSATGSSTTLPSGSGQSFTLTPNGNDVISCTLTNTAKQADLSITKTADKATYAAGENVVYTVTASNAGPNPAGGAVVADTLPNQTLSLGWTCAASGGAACPSTSGSGNVNQTIATFPSGGKVVYTITALARTVGTGIVNTATVTAPATVLDPATGNNTASATLAINAPAAGPAYPGPGPVSKYATCLDFSNMPNLGAGQSYSSNVVTPDGITVYYTLNVTSVVNSAPGAATTTDAVGKYVPGTWQGDRWQQYFGAGKTNAIANVTQGRQAFYTLSAYAQIGTLAVPLTLLTGSAEEDGQNNLADPARPIEYTQSTTNGTPFAVADVYTTGGAYRRVTVSNGGTTESMTIGSLDGNGNLNQTNILLMATTKTNATSASPLTLTSSLLGGGITAQAFCTSFSADRGDDPTSYGAANALLNPTYGPGLSDGFRTLDQLTAGTRSDDTTVYLGNGKPSAEDVPRGTNGTGDTDDGVSSFAALSTASTTYSVTVAYNNTSGGNAILSGWIDFNRNGTFEAAEKANVTVAAGSGNATLTWTGLTGLVKGQSYARFRISTDAASAGLPTGTSPNGEVEDYPLTIQNNPPTTANVTNATLLDSAPATVLNPNLSAVDTDGTVTTYTIATLPTAASGVLTLNGTAVTAGQTFNANQLGNLTFKPVAGFSGNANFTYSATDDNGAASNTSTYTIPVNRPPTTANVTNAVLVNTAPATTLNPNLSATDPDGTIATYTIATLPTAASGVLALNGTAVTAGQTFNANQLGNLTFKPVAGFSGNASFTYSATDNQGASSNTSTYTIPVNNPPTTANVTNATLLDTAAATVLNPNLSAADSDGTIASYTIVTLPTAASGMLALNGTAVTAGQTFNANQLANLTFKPTAGFSGNATFTYSATDNQGAISNTSTYTLPVNVAPVANNDSGATNPNVNVTFSITGNDTDTSPGTVDVTTTTFDPSSTGTIGNNGKTLTVAGQGVFTLDNNGNVTFAPAAGFNNGTSTAKYTVKDNNGAVSNVATITVTVPASVDLAITKTGPAYFKPGDTLSYTLIVTNSGSAATGVSVTDTLPSGLTFASASNGGTYNAGTGKVTWSLGNVANGSTTTLTLTGTAPTAASTEANNGPTSLVNSASVAGNETEVVTNNNSASTTAQLVYPKLSKRVRNVTQNGAFGTVGTGKPGEALEYCIDFKNYGVGVSSFVISDSVPSNTNASLSGYGAGLGLQVTRGNATTTRTSTSGDTDGGSLSATALSLDLGTLAAGESGTVCFQASIK